MTHLDRIKAHAISCGCLSSTHSPITGKKVVSWAEDRICLIAQILTKPIISSHAHASIKPRTKAFNYRKSIIPSSRLLITLFRKLMLGSIFSSILYASKFSTSKSSTYHSRGRGLVPCSHFEHEIQYYCSVYHSDNSWQQQLANSNNPCMLPSREASIELCIGR